MASGKRRTTVGTKRMRAGRTGTPLDAIALLRADHREVTGWSMSSNQPAPNSRKEGSLAKSVGR